LEEVLVRASALDADVRYLVVVDKKRVRLVRTTTYVYRDFVVKGEGASEYEVFFEDIVRVCGVKFRFTAEPGIEIGVDGDAVIGDEYIPSVLKGEYTLRGKDIFGYEVSVVGVEG
jgi:hypothetical protein